MDQCMAFVAAVSRQYFIEIGWGWGADSEVLAYSCIFLYGAPRY